MERWSKVLRIRHWSPLLVCLLRKKHRRRRLDESFSPLPAREARGLNWIRFFERLLLSSSFSFQRPWTHQWNLTRRTTSGPSQSPTSRRSCSQRDSPASETKTIWSRGSSSFKAIRKSPRRRRKRIRGRSVASLVDRGLGVVKEVG